MKRILTLFIAVLICSVMAGAYNAGETPVQISVNGQYISSDEEPFLYNGRAYAPIRFIYQSMFPCDIAWNPATKTATVLSENYIISLDVNNNKLTVNGSGIYMSDKMILKNGRLFAPVRAIADSLNAGVSWNAAQGLAEIGAPGSDEYTQLTQAQTYSDDDLFWMSRIIEAEAGAEPMNGKIAVGNVILNRINSKEFPDTIYDVIFDRKYSVQFEPVSNGTIYNTPSNESIEAAKRALSGEKIIGDCLYFLNPSKASNTWIIKNRKYVQTIGSHAFYA